MTRSAGFAALFVALVGLLGCAINPATGRRDFVLVSSETERRLGDDEAARIAATMGLVDDADLVAYVRAIGARLARVAPGSYEYEFQIADTPEPNAFALPGGHVYVSRGLLALANSEDELAGVIGHEIGHVAARHAVQRVSLGAPLGIVTGVAAAATSIVAPRVGGLVAGIGGVGTQLVMNPYGRSQERESDEIGQTMAARAGWDPAGLGAFLETLEREEALTRGSVRRLDFLSSHPSTPSRIADARRRAGELPYESQPGIAQDREALLQRLDGVVVGANPATGVVRESRFLHPDLDFTIQFPSGWTIANQAAVVAAGEPAGAASMMLQGAGAGGDVRARAAAFERENAIEFSSPPRETSIGGRPAVRAATNVRDGGRVVALDLTWIAHAERIYLLSGVCQGSDVAHYGPVFEEVVRSFRALSAAERTSFEVVRLRPVAARAGETVADLARRTGSEWDAATVAMANALPPNARFSAGQRVKIARREPYRAR